MAGTARNLGQAPETGSGTTRRLFYIDWPLLFYEVRRLDIVGDDPVPDDTEGRFHVLNVVEGEGIEIVAAAGVHPLAYAETVVVPASVGAYSLRRVGDGPTRVVKALVQ